jgi:isochorismate hydrolase
MYTNKVNWRLEPGRCALLIHDMQPHYLGAISADRRDALIANVQAISATCLRQGVPVFASTVAPAQDGRERGLMLDLWGRGPALGRHGLDAGLGLADQAIRPLTKRSYSAFYGTDLEVMLRRLRCNAILITGVYTSIGCYLSAIDAFARDIRAFLIADATADMTQEDHEAGLRMAARTCACIIDTEAVKGAIAGPTEQAAPDEGHRL